MPAPGSDSRIYGPNPAAIVVAIDPGHGGCLDWGVPNPYDNRVERSEKALTLAISLALRDQLEAEGVTVVMTRQADVALAGDLYPELGCHGDAFRDVNGDGYAGFGSLFPEDTRTRDELAAHIDLVNLARADVLVSVHINSLTQDGDVLEIAATETFWTDETPWGVPLSERLATLVQDEVVTALSGVAPYVRQDRGIDAVNYYIIAPATETGDPREPRRGILMPGVLAEVGSMSLAAEADLLATDDAQQAIAGALVDALAAWFADRSLAVRMDLLAPGGQAGISPEVERGDGPMFWPLIVGPPRGGIRVTNTGSDSWPAGMQLLVGWAPTAEPYLARPPRLAPLDVEVPALAPGESVVLELRLPDPPSGVRSVAWITLWAGNTVLSDLGVPPLQLAIGPS
ncbi:MAG TPA: N-acetylmuramoyl-L-alanine amidase [Pleomorphomonadaceae bacterium]|nr:N-acetylmuramoyl-L-alanine amidase [Pleomorphomonadaceae bacterium]